MGKIKAQATTLIPWDACPEARAWVAAHRGTPKEIWQSCPRGDWLLWFAARWGVTRRLVTEAACDCAEEALRHVDPDSLLACVWALDAARRYVRGAGTEEEVVAATDAANAAADIAAAHAAAATVEAAATANVTAAEVEPAAVATYTAIAAAAAAYNAAYNAAYDVTASATAACTAATHTVTHVGVHAASLARSAELVRRRIPWSAVVTAWGRTMAQ